MLDEIEINKYLDIDSCNELFGKKDYLLYIVLFILYVVFVEGKNYLGYSFKFIKSEFLMKYVYENFIDELKVLDNVCSILIIFLGRCVEEVLYKLVDYGIMNKN